MIDLYFRRPLFWDYLFAIIIASGFIYFQARYNLFISDLEKLYSIISDLATISLTLAGFVLTLLTVLISFKSSFEEVEDKKTEAKTTFVYFFSTGFYFQTVNHLKRAILSLTLVALSGYLLKLISAKASWLFAYDIFGVTVVFFTLWRCLLILSKIIRMQQEK